MNTGTSAKDRLPFGPFSHTMLLTDREFRKFSSLIYDACGINLPPVKKTMLSSRLHKRLRALEISTFKEYLEYVLGPRGGEQEFIRLLDVVSTNKTEFFREPEHFGFLTDRILPEYRPRTERGGTGRRLRIWSAGCSSGEEPYTLAIVLAEFAERNPGFDYSILATDISTRVLATAEQAVYSDERLAGIPKWYLHKYFLRGTGSQRNFHRVAPELRSKVTFRRLNFKDNYYGIDKPLDIIFCRNVIIYFDRPTQAALFEQFYNHLAPGGYLLIGHSETLEGIFGRFRRIAPTVYQK
jgi:chemotaxis protein methyltransferase CheR